MNLLTSWAKWKPKNSNYAVEGDREYLKSPKSTEAITLINGWHQATRNPDFCRPGDTKIHLGLIPQPFCGNVGKATIYLLFLNPGLGPSDYYGEYEVPAYRKALLNNLKQNFSDKQPSFMFLDPRFAWHEGFQWWHGKLRSVIEEMSNRFNIPYAEARSLLADQLASIELFPYHSASFKDADNWIKKLTSVQLARSFVHDYIVPRAKSGKAIIIATRAVKMWDLPEHPNIICYEGGHARAAHLSASSKGGKAILEHVRRKTT